MNWVIAKIKSIRQALGYSQQYMADKIGVDIRTYGNWERGINEINLPNLKKVAEVLKVDIKELWDEEKWVSKSFKKPETVSTVEEQKTFYRAATAIPVECKSIVDLLEKEITILKEQNLALTRAFNDLFDKKKELTKTQIV